MRKYFFICFLIVYNLATAQNNISKCEYWFDNNKPDAIIEQITHSETHYYSKHIDTEHLSLGLHRFNIRFQDEQAKWSAVTSQFFFKVSEDIISNNKIIAFEYWVESFHELKTKVEVSPNNPLEIENYPLKLKGVEIDLTKHDAEYYDTTYFNLNIRFLDSKQKWSSVSSSQFKLNPFGIDNNLEISFAESINLENYQNSIIYLKNCDTDKTSSITLNNNTLYTFSGLTAENTYKAFIKNKYDAELGSIDNVLIKAGDNKVQFSNLNQLNDIKVKVVDENGADLSDKIKVKWFSETDTFISFGTTISQVPSGSNLKYQVLLPEDLQRRYHNPELQQVENIESNKEIVYNLQPYPEIEIKGIVKNNSDNSILANATVSVVQDFGDGYSNTIQGKTDNDGVFSISAVNTTSTIYASSYGYVDKIIEIESFNNQVNEYEIKLDEISGAVLTLDMKYTYSTSNGTTVIVDENYINYENLSFEVYNKTQNKTISNYQLQFPEIVIFDELNENDEIEVTATSSINEFSPSSASGQLDTELKTNISLNFTQKGSFRGKCVNTTNSLYVSLVFNQAGELIDKYNYNFQGTVSSSELPDGQYTVVSMVSSEYFNNFNLLNQFSDMGLTEGKDYIASAINIETGIITNFTVDQIPELNENEFRYTNEFTSFSINKSSVTAGSFLAVRGFVQFKEVFADRVSDVHLIVELPEKCDYVSGSMIRGGFLCSDYTRAGNTFNIPLNNLHEIVKFCFIPTQGGIINAHASIEFSLNGQQIKQPIGSAQVDVTDLDIRVPSRTAQNNVTVSGNARPNANVTLFDSNIIVGKTQANANGIWQIPLAIDDEFDFSIHDIYAKVETHSNIKVNTLTKQLVYDKNCIEVSKVTMINTAHPAGTLNTCEYTTVFDFLNPSDKAPIYWYWPKYPTFTFLVEFTNNNPDLVSDVVINVETSSGNIIPVKAVFDASKQMWVGIKDFQSGSLPVNVDVQYNKSSKYDPIKDFSSTDIIYSLTNLEEFKNDLVENDFIHIKQNQQSSNTYTLNYLNEEIKITYEDFDNLNETPQIIDQSKILEGSGTPDDPFILHISNSKIKNTGHNNLQNDQVAKYLETAADFSGDINAFVSTVNLGNDIISEIRIEKIQHNKVIRKLKYRIKGSGKALSMLTENQRLYKLGKNTKAFLDSDGFGIFSNIIDGANMISVASEQNYKLYNLGERLRWLKLECVDTYNVNDELKERLDRIQLCSNVLTGSNACLFAAGFGEGVGTLLVSISSAVVNHFTNNEELIREKIYGLDKDIEYWESVCKPKPDKDKHRGSPADYVMDPSGYTYEAVSSNRLQGVTTTLFHKTTEEDMYGNQQENVVVWNSEAYGQTNPLITDENGMYAWDVPEGLWQVIYEKDGYETMYSDWLPVPPPQLEVNIGLSHGVSPTVLSATGYTDAIEIEFDNYMQVTELVSANFEIIKDGALLANDIILKNQEENPKNKTETFASKIKLELNKQLSNGDKVLLCISKNVKSYCGIKMENDYETEIIIQLRANKIEAPDQISLSNNSTVPITVKVLPKEASAGKKVKASSISPSIATVNEEMILDETGSATFNICANLPGSSHIQFVYDDNELQAETSVNVEMPIEQLRQPTVSIPSGTTVDQNTTVILSSNTTGATIYYTTDGSNPTTSNTRVLYQGAIAINNNIQIKAVVEKAGMLTSNVATFLYNIVVKNELEVAICSNENYLFAGEEINLAGTYSDTIQTFDGQDSIVILNLKVNPIYQEDISVSICKDQSFHFNELELTESGQYSATYQSADGCDSIVVLDLIVSQGIKKNIYKTICTGGTYTFNGQKLTESGQYTASLQSINGCDSIVILDLEVLPNYNKNITTTICEGESYNFNGLALSESGKYSATYQSADGCDSIVTLDLIIAPKIKKNIYKTICTGSNYIFNGDVLTESGQYTKTLKARNGCDSIVVLDLEVATSYNKSLAITICQGESYSFNGTTIAESGRYTENFPATNGCDSIVVLDLIVSPIYERLIDTTICQGEVININNRVLSETGEYRIPLTNKFGCDSIIIMNLTTHPLPETPEIRQIQDTLEVDSTLRCIWFKDDIEIPDSDTFRIIIKESGDYRVMVFNEKDCGTSSEPISAIKTHSGYFSHGSIYCKIFPNPNNGSFKIELLNAMGQEVNIKLSSVRGMEISNYHIQNYLSPVFIDEPGLSDGSYILSIIMEGKVISHKIIISH